MNVPRRAQRSHRSVGLRDGYPSMSGQADGFAASGLRLRSVDPVCEDRLVSADLEMALRLAWPMPARAVLTPTTIIVGEFFGYVTVRLRGLVHDEPTDIWVEFDAMAGPLSMGAEELLDAVTEYMRALRLEQPREHGRQLTLF